MKNFCFPVFIFSSGGDGPNLRVDIRIFIFIFRHDCSYYLHIYIGHCSSRSSEFIIHPTNFSHPIHSNLLTYPIHSTLSHPLHNSHSIQHRNCFHFIPQPHHPQQQCDPTNLDGYPLLPPWITDTRSTTRPTLCKPWSNTWRSS